MIVRLKGRAVIRCMARFCESFNSMIVRLKAFGHVIDLPEERGFNSMIVRLKGRNHGGIMGRGSAFQFYDSPIKSTI